MTPMDKFKDAFVPCLLLLCACRSDQPLPVYDGFESATLTPAWSMRKFVPGAVEIQSAIVRSGQGAARVTLRSGDQIESEKGSVLERAELLESKKLWAAEDGAYSYAFSLFMPVDFPVVPSRLVIAQWKQDCEPGKCDPASPVLAVRIRAGELSINVQSGPSKQVLFQTTGDVRNRWLDFRFHVRFSRTSTGRIKTWLNDSLVVDYAGPTAYPGKYGYEEPGRFYFKTGLYRDRTGETMVIYVDEYEKSRLPGVDLL
jgi:hypothetical protein